MKREEAIRYLQKKGEIALPKVIQPEFSIKDEEKILSVIKKGKIYGDPLVEIKH